MIKMALNGQVSWSGRGWVVLATLCFLIDPAGARAGPDTRVGQGGDFELTTASDIYAQIKPREETVLSSELAAKIIEITVRDGERFKKGDVLMRLDCAVVKAGLAKFRAIMTAAARTYDVQKRLLELNSAGSLEVELAAADVAKARADVLAQSVIVSKCIVKAPFSGLVVEQKARTHQFVKKGDPVLEILDDSALEVEFIAPSNWLSWIRPGHGFTVNVNETGRGYGGSITRLGGRVDPVSQSVKVYGEIVGSVEGLVPGMSGQITIEPQLDPQPALRIN
ncbi:MAG: efflux RND transporter periplasmic adaptor subunit [Magnetovibrio sp.]|nr:efflux RND transporter periplasmic adaptor subunit [Magnetovibrio sp.]